MLEARKGNARTGLSRTLRYLHHTVFDESREGRAYEIVAWSKAFAGFGLGAGAFVLTRSHLAALCALLATLVLLRAALTSRRTLWIAASLGTASVAACGGALTWLFGHVIEVPAVPFIAGVLGATTSAAVPAWAYARLARRRAESVPDSLLEPLSVPVSRS